MSFELIWCDRAVGNLIFLPSEAGGRSLATRGTNDLVHFNPVAPFDLVRSDTEEACLCVAQARRCSDDVKIAIYVREDLIDFTKTYLAGGGLFDTGVCVYFNEADERILGCACVTGGTPYPFAEFDGDCETCLGDHTDPPFYVHAFTCGTVPKPIDLWALESDVTLDSQVYWAGPDYGCVIFKGPPSLDHGTLIDVGDLTEQSSCTSCRSTHAYVRAYNCDTDVATGIYVPEGSVDTSKAYRREHRCFYFTAQTYSPPPVPPTSRAELTEFASCEDCGSLYVESLDCEDDSPLDVWAFVHDIDPSTFYVIEGVCARFIGDTTSVEPDNVVGPGGGYTTCEECYGNTEDCPTDNLDNRTHDYLVQFIWPDSPPDSRCGVGDVNGVPLFSTDAVRLTPQGDGTWKFVSLDPVSGQPVERVTIVCEGKTWRLSHENLGAAPFARSQVWDVPRTGTAPPLREWNITTISESPPFCGFSPPARAITIGF